MGTDPLELIGQTVERRSGSRPVGWHWPDMLRVAGSLLTNTVRSYDLIRMFARDGHPVRDEDVARLSPLGHAHINMLGRYAFTPRTDQTLRPLRDPDAVDE